MQSELWCTQTLRNVRIGIVERLVRSMGSRRHLDGTAVLGGESIPVSGYPGSSPGEKDLWGTGEEGALRNQLVAGLRSKGFGSYPKGMRCEPIRKF